MLSQTANDLRGLVGFDTSNAETVGEGLGLVGCASARLWSAPIFRSNRRQADPGGGRRRHLPGSRQSHRSAIETEKNWEDGRGE